MSARPFLRRLWTMPLLLAASTVFGLLAALLGEGAWQWLAWIALAIPLAVTVRHAFSRVSPARVP